ncbi:MAG TPA: glycosyltransferase [Burkholderiales bacterium]|nr:glycosyltransferase [Burkholderiales bacterium]
MLHVHEINLQRIAGGGEVYTRAFSRALADAGAKVTLYVRRDNAFWNGLDGPSLSLCRLRGAQDLVDALPAERAVVLTQGPIERGVLKRIAARHWLASFAHMPIQGGRGVDEFRDCRLVLTVSRYCIGLLRDAGIGQVYGEPMYGVADAARGDPRAAVEATSCYLWDHRKVRDRLLGLLEPLTKPLRPRRRFEKRSGLTLGIVSLLMPIKQFPLLFRYLGPILARHDANVEIFGAGGYAQVRDLKRAIEPIAARTRFWGLQRDVAAVYPKIDYLLTGLPEKEALGLNVLESQACGTPVLAPRAPPFTETLIDGTSGFLYADPRSDGGEDFERVLAKIIAAPERPNPLLAAQHLSQFTYAALVARTARLLREIEQTTMHE